MIDLQKVKKIVADTIYDNIDCTYCEYCRFDKEIADTDCDCPFHSGQSWAISHKESNTVAEKIVENVFKDLFNWR